VSSEAIMSDLSLSLSFKRNPLLNIAIILTLAIPLLLVFGRACADIAMSIVSILFLCQSCVRRNWSWFKTPWFILACVTSCFMLLTGLLAQYDRMAAITGAINWLRFPLFAMAFGAWILPDEKARRYLLPSLMLLLVACSVDTIVQFLTGTSLTGQSMPGMAGRLTGPIVGHLVIGIFLTRLAWPTIGLACMWAFAKPAEKKRLLLPAMLIVLLGFTILITGERIALFLFFLSGLVFLLFAKNMRKQLLPVVVVAAILSALLIFTIPTLHERLIGNTRHVIENISASSYGAVWHNGFIAWKSAPVFGIGLGNFVPMCEKAGVPMGFRNELPEWTGLHCVRHPHNPYLEWLADLGVIGLICFIGLIICWGRQIKRNMPDFESNTPLYYAHLGFAVGLIPFLWPFMPSISFFINWGAMSFWWVLGLALSNYASKPFADRPLE
jgi:O-antigen ligase